MSALDKLYALCNCLGIFLLVVSIQLFFTWHELKAAKKEIKHLNKDVAYYQERLEELRAPGIEESRDV